MATIDFQARLAKVQAAIEAILDRGAQSYNIDGRSFTSLDLKTLQDEERRLVARINRAGRRGGAFRTVVG